MRTTPKQTEKVPRKDKTMVEIIRLRRLADKGDEKAMAELREEFNARPYLWEVGNMATQAEIALTEVITGGSKVLKEATNKKLDDLKVELLGPAPTPLERLQARNTNKDGELSQLPVFTANCESSLI